MTHTTAILRRTFLVGVASAAIAAPLTLSLPAFAQDEAVDVSALERVQVELVAPLSSMSTSRQQPVSRALFSFGLKLKSVPR